MGTLSWIAVALLGLGLAAAGHNLLRGRALLLSWLFAALFGGGLWTLLGLPAAQAPLAVLGIGAIGGALGAVLARGAAYSVLSMLLTLLCLAGVYLLLGFPFLAAAQTILHAGAVAILFLLVVASLGLGRQLPGSRAASGEQLGLAGPILAGALAGLAMVGVLAAGGVEGAIDPAALALRQPLSEATVSGGGAFSLILFGRYLLPFEATALLLLASLIGLSILAGGPRRAPGKEQ